MSEYMLPTELVKRAVIESYAGNATEFDRWLAELIRMAKADGFDEGWDARVNAETITPTENPYRQGETE